MPLFIYKCSGCDFEDEFLVRRDGTDAPQKCEKCGKSLEKQISLSSFQLKGGGWYKDLYSSAKPEKSS